ncbi:MAG: glycosyltransferase [Candidatus Kaiserbacteria bacterium]|nr:glycosyltransferase [Candidatus Kaiserbacteria bacterium]
MQKVSIIIPTYNAEKFLDKAVESVLVQTFKDWELIIVDDCSKDNTREIVKDWEAKDERIHSIFLNENSGTPAHPKNVGIEIAEGEYIAYLDQDDAWLPEKLRKQVNILDHNSQVGFLSCEAFIVNESGKILNRKIILNIPESGELLPAILCTNFMFSNSSLMIRRKVIEQCGPRDERPEIGGAEDLEYQFRVAVAGYHFHIIHEPLYKYRVHKNNLSRNRENALHGAMARYKYIDIYKKYGLVWFLQKNTAYSLLRNGNTKDARNYLNLFFSEKSPTFREHIVYILTYFGWFGSRLFFLIITIMNKIKEIRLY